MCALIELQFVLKRGVNNSVMTSCTGSKPEARGWCSSWNLLLH